MFLQVLCLCGHNVADFSDTLKQVPQTHIARCERWIILKFVEGFSSYYLQRGKCSHIYLLPDIAVILSPEVLSRGFFSLANRQKNIRGRYS